MAYPSFSEQMRILRSFEMSVIRRSDEIFEVINRETRHRYKVKVLGQKVLCPCPDAEKGNHCKHQHAVERNLEYFEASFSFSEVGA